MATHTAIVTTAIHAPLETLQVPTITPRAGEVRVRVEWTASTPLDLHQADGGLLVKHPQVLGDTIAGTVVEVGADVKSLKIGDKVYFPLKRPKSGRTDGPRSSVMDGASRRKRHTRNSPYFPNISSARWVWWPWID